MNLFTKDAGERILRAFVTGAVTAALALSVHNGGNFFEHLTGTGETGLSAILGGGIVAALTATKALIGMGVGANPDDGSLKGVVSGEES